MRAFHQSLHLWIRRPIGRLASMLLLLLAIACAALPSGKVHAHTGGAVEHGHEIAPASVASFEHDNHSGPSEPVGDVVLHAHDIGTTSTGLPPLPVMMTQNDMASSSLGSRLVVSSPPSEAPLPPYRPPII